MAMWFGLRAARAASLAVRRSSALLSARTFSSAANGGPPYSVLFFGTDDVSLATLRRLHANSQESDPAKRLVGNITVICPSDRKVGGGRGKADGFSPVPVKRFALKHGLPVTHTPPNVKSLKQWRPELFETQRFDVGVVVSFGYFLHPHLTENLAHGAINMHPSLLPKYRGPAPIHHALLNGDAVTGVSVIEIDPRTFDVGRVLLQKPFDVPADITCGPLASQLAEYGAECVLETLADLKQRKLHAGVQDDKHATHAPKIKLQDGFLTLSETADQIFYRWQALSDNVGVSVHFKDKDVKLVELRRPSDEELASVREEEQRVCSSQETQPPQFSAGSFFFDKKLNALWLKCASGSWLLITKLQQADRKVGSAIDFANGYRLKRSLQQFEAISAIEVSP